MTARQLLIPDKCGCRIAACQKKTMQGGCMVSGSFGSAYDTDSARIKAVSYMDEHTGEYSEYGGCIYKGYFYGDFLHYVIQCGIRTFAKHR